MQIGVIDYGVGNIANVIRCLEYVAKTESIKCVNTHKDIQACDKIVLPGVGAFSSAMQHLSARDLDKSLCEYAKSGRYMLGICLGMQLLFEKSYEFGEYNGLELIKGFVTPFGSKKSIEWHKKTNMDFNNIESKKLDSNYYSNIQNIYAVNNKNNKNINAHLKIPHIGWNKNFIKKPNTLCASMKDSFYLYFVHSYHVCCDTSFIIATCDYGISFPSIIAKDNILGIQPHPERSHKMGFKLINDFLRLS